jgi:dimeric dUTPase (all-alpha-NTP-PPase superfamily)
MSRFDCWIGHTNFNITTSIKNKLNEVDGIEVLNIVSRYRFFIGIGKMFKFSDVRKDIEKSIISKGETLGNAIEESS